MMYRGVYYKFYFRCLCCNKYTVTNVENATICDECMDRQEEDLAKKIVLLSQQVTH